MMYHVWTVICSRSVTDKKTNNISLQNVIEQVSIEEPPARPVSPDEDIALLFPFEVVTLWARSELEQPATGLVRLVLRRPSGKTMTTPDLTIRLAQHHRRRSQFSFQSLPIDQSGYFWFAVELQCPVGSEWEEVSKVPLEMRVRPREEDSEGEDEG